MNSKSRAKLRFNYSPHGPDHNALRDYLRQLRYERGLRFKLLLQLYTIMDCKQGLIKLMSVAYGKVNAANIIET